MTTDLILGTAGHIDHGKTSLIRALTGTNTDRLPEEKKRGITIELGFAELVLDEFRLGIVDVPGHEKFVRQMLAGATGMDLAMLVVAADDSVKQQTIEHLDVLRILDLPAGVIAMTKCDVADQDWMDLVEDEIRELVQDTFLKDAPLVRTSSHTGQGLDELCSALTAAARVAAASERANRRNGPFRMAVDRVFSMEGHGTVVTGSVSSGSAKVGDVVKLEPGELEVRIRGIQNHDRPADVIARGQRAAINLAGVHHDQIQRGHEVASAGYLQPSKLVTAHVNVLPSAPRPIKNRSKVRLHIGTAEVIATAALLGTERLEPGQSGFVQLFLSEPIVATWNQPFVLRSESPVETIAGGRILVPAANKIKKYDSPVPKMLEKLRSGDALERASAAYYFAGVQQLDSQSLVRTAGIQDDGQTFQTLVEQGVLVPLNLPGQKKLHLHQDVLDEFGNRMIAALDRLHEAQPLSTVFDKSSVASQFEYLGHQNVFDAIVALLEKKKTLRSTAKGIGLADRAPKLSKNERELLTQIIETFRTARFQPPTVKEVQAKATKNQASVPNLVKLAASDGDLVEVSADYYLHADLERELKELMQTAILERGGISVGEIRELLQTSRKYAVPFCEYLDKIGFTKRDGDVRILNSLPSAS
ncbi:MAG: selenocysteine-specific translation elongation factor [Planctomycetales bacterium]|nr:selenocysteine-specific translation elongation factor [Planctomycetales bacterium]